MLICFNCTLLLVFERRSRVIAVNSACNILVCLPLRYQLFRLLSESDNSEWDQCY